MFGARHYLTGLVVCAEIKHFIIKSSSNHRYLCCEAACFFYPLSILEGFTATFALNLYACAVSFTYL